MIVMVVLSDHGRPELGGGDDCYGCVLSDHGRSELRGGDDCYGCVVMRSRETGTGWR